MQSDLVDLPDSLWLQYQFRSYRNPKARINRLVQRGDLIRLKRGLYLSSWATSDPYRLGRAANRLYGPSYVSFEYALRWYGLIPEHVAHITSATFRRNRSKRFDTSVGSFLYRDVPSTAYPHSVFLERRRSDYEGQTTGFLIASPEKAICDQLYRISGVRSHAAIEQLMFDDLRLDRSAYMQLDHDLLATLSGLYRTETLSALGRHAGRRVHA